ncbi:hypothetical protein Tco_0512473 [Tanacetum coccineum]
MVKPVWNNAQRVNHQNFAKKTHPCAKKNLVPRAVLMKSGLVSINTARQNISKIAVLVNTARQVNAAHSKITVNAARPMSYLSKIAHSTVKRVTRPGPLFRYSVMSDSNESRITYTEVSSPFEDLSDIGSPRADDHEYLELPEIPKDPYVEAALQAPPSPDCVPGPKEPEQAPHSPDYVPGPEHTDDEIIAEDQPGAKDASPTAQSPDYVSESDPEADLEEEDDEDPEEDPVYYLADGGDDGDDEEG